MLLRPKSGISRDNIVPSLYVYAERMENNILQLEAIVDGNDSGHNRIDETICTFMGINVQKVRRDVSFMVSSDIYLYIPFHGTLSGRGLASAKYI